MSVYRPVAPSRAPVRPRTAPRKARPVARRAARGRRDSDAFVVLALTIVATLIAVYDLALLAFSVN